MTAERRRHAPPALFRLRTQTEPRSAMQLDLSTANPAPTPRATPKAPSSLVGLDRAGMGEALREVGVPERQVRMRTGQLWAVDLRARRPALRGDDQRLQIVEGRPREPLHAGSPAGHDGAGLFSDGTRKWLIGLEGEFGRQPRGRDRLHSRSRSRHAVRLCPRSAARSTAPSVIRARRRWCAT